MPQSNSLSCSFLFVFSVYGEHALPTAEPSRLPLVAPLRSSRPDYHGLAHILSACPACGTSPSARPKPSASPSFQPRLPPSAPLPCPAVAFDGARLAPRSKVLLGAPHVLTSVLASPFQKSPPSAFCSLSSSVRDTLPHFPNPARPVRSSSSAICFPSFS